MCFQCSGLPRTGSYGPRWRCGIVCRADQRRRFADGNESWIKAFGSDLKGEERASSISQVEDGGYIIAGWTTSIGDSSADVLLIRLDAQGDEVWQKVLNIRGN